MHGLGRSNVDQNSVGERFHYWNYFSNTLEKYFFTMMKHNIDAWGIVVPRARHDLKSGQGSTRLFIQRYKVNGHCGGRFMMHQSLWLSLSLYEHGGSGEAARPIGSDLSRNRTTGYGVIFTSGVEQEASQNGYKHYQIVWSNEGTGLCGLMR